MKRALALLAFSAASAFAGPLYSTTATLAAVNGQSVDGNYTGPYTLVVGGESFEAWCDDFADHVSIGQTWDVDVYAGTDTAGAYFTPEQYRDMFELVADGMMGGSDRIAVQQAIWRVTDQNYTAGVQYTAMSQVYAGEYIVISGHGAPGERPQEFIARRRLLETGGMPPLIPTPEPATWSAMIGAILMLAGWRKRGMK